MILYLRSICARMFIYSTKVHNIFKLCSVFPFSFSKIIFLYSFCSLISSCQCQSLLLLYIYLSRAAERSPVYVRLALMWRAILLCDILQPTGNFRAGFCGTDRCFRWVSGMFFLQKSSLYGLFCTLVLGLLQRLYI